MKTAKLSDGTEWEIKSQHVTSDGEIVGFFGKRIVNTPKEIWVRNNADACIFNDTNTPPYDVKYVRADLIGSEAMCMDTRKPRERWVLWIKSSNMPWGTFATRDLAEKERLARGTPDNFFIILMREVL